MACHDSGLSPFIRGEIHLQTHEIVERRMVARYVQLGDVVLEAGAGIGSVTRVLLAAGASVDAYEPSEEPFYLLQQLATIYSGRCQVSRAALGLITGPGPFHVYDPWYASRTVELGGEVPRATVLIDVCRLRDVLGARQYDGVVMDVEGAEHALLPELLLEDPVRWVVAELHGDPARLAATIVSMQLRYRLDAVEVHAQYLVCGWMSR